MSDTQRRAFWNRALRRRLADEAAVAKEWPEDGKIRPETVDEYCARVISQSNDPSLRRKIQNLAPIYVRRRKADSAEG